MGDVLHFSFAMCALKYSHSQIPLKFLALSSGVPLESTLHSQDVCTLKYLAASRGLHYQVPLTLKSLSSSSQSQVGFLLKVPCTFKRFALSKGLLTLKWVSTCNGLLPRQSISPSVTATVAYAGSRMVNCTPAAFSPGYL